MEGALGGCGPRFKGSFGSDPTLTSVKRSGGHYPSPNEAGPRSLTGLVQPPIDLMNARECLLKFYTSKKWYSC